MSDLHDLYRRHAPDVYRFALYLSGNRAEAEDITSETFVRVWTSPGPVRMATVRGYLFTIARNLHLQGLRRKRRHVELPEDLRDTARGPAEDNESRARIEATVEALQQLPESDRAALLMRALHEMPYEEIARAMGLSLAATKVRIHRARLALAKLRRP